MQTAIAQPQKVSLLHQYGQISAVRKRRRKPDVLPVLVDDPYAAGEKATLAQPPRGAKTLAGGEWVVPMKQPVEVYASRRSAVANLYGQGLIDKAMFAAALTYERVYATAMALPVKTVDPGNPVVSGGGGAREAIDAVIAASNELERIETYLCNRHGSECIALVRAVAAQGLTVERFARERGETGRVRVKWWGGLFRRALEVLAEASGQAVKNAYENREREETRLEREAKRRERKEREALKAKKQKRKEGRK